MRFAVGRNYSNGDRTQGRGVLVTVILTTWDRALQVVRGREIDKGSWNLMGDTSGGGVVMLVARLRSQLNLRKERDSATSGSFTHSLVQIRVCGSAAVETTVKGRIATRLWRS